MLSTEWEGGGDPVVSNDSKSVTIWEIFNQICLTNIQHTEFSFFENLLS